PRCRSRRATASTGGRSASGSSPCAVSCSSLHSAWVPASFVTAGTGSEAPSRSVLEPIGNGPRSGPVALDRSLSAEQSPARRALLARTHPEGSHLCVAALKPWCPVSPPRPAAAHLGGLRGTAALHCGPTLR